MNTINSYESAMTTIVDIDLELNKMYAEIIPGRKLPACINNTALDTLLAKAQNVFSSLVRPQHADELDMERYYSLCITLYCVAESLFDSHVLLARSDKKRAHFGWNQKDSSACASVEESINNMLEDAGEDAEVAVLRPMFTNEGIVGHAVDPYIAFACKCAKRVIAEFPSRCIKLDGYTAMLI